MGPRNSGLRGGARGLWLPAVRAEVLQVLQRVPAAAPAPADPGEGVDDRTAGQDHAGPLPAAVAVGTGQLGEDEIALEVGVLEGVDVDRQAVGVLAESGRASHG